MAISLCTYPEFRTDMRTGPSAGITFLQCIQSSKAGEVRTILEETVEKAVVDN